MSIENYSFKSADDTKTTIHAVKWTPEGEPVAVLQIAHGMQEHIERYTGFAEYLNKQGFVVMGHDHIGHGESVASEAELGLMHTDTPSDTMVEDMFTNYKLIKEQYPNIPYFILGHSMGSYLLRKYLSKKGSELKGVNGAIVMGTGTVQDSAIKAGMTVCKLIAKFKGWDHKSSFVAGLMFDANYKKFDITGEHPENSWLSKNVENVKAYYDPANKKDCCPFSLNGYRVLLEATGFDNNMDNIKKMNMDIPIFFVSGSEDPVGAMGEGVKAAKAKFEEAGVKDLTMKLYEGDRHEILNELDRETVYADLYNWMKDRF